MNEGASSPWKTRSILDYFLQPIFFIICLVSSFTFVRLWIAIFFMFPVYLVLKFVSSLPNLLYNIPLLITPSGRTQLAQQAQSYRKDEGKLSQQQFEGTFKFQDSQLTRLTYEEKHEIKKMAGWFPHTEEMTVCEAKVSVVVEKATEHDNGRSVVLMHGNPSWSYMWRDVIPRLTSSGYTVYALDLIGHGLSDKPKTASLISFELHMETVLTLFDHYSLLSHTTTIVAHDWGGCMTACASPFLVPSTSNDLHMSASGTPRLLILNSFLPPRPDDITLNTYGLYMLWFFTCGILGGYTPETAIMRYMAPMSSTVASVRGYAAPYHRSPATKTDIGRLSHIIPGLPDLFLFRIRESIFWQIFEGAIGPEKCTNFNAQAALAKRNVRARKYWSGCAKLGWKVGVVFGRDDPLLIDFKGVWEKTLDAGALVEMPKRGWIAGAGHYPAEEQAAEVTEQIRWFIEQTSEKDGSH